MQPKTKSTKRRN